LPLEFHSGRNGHRRTVRWRRCPWLNRMSAPRRPDRIRACWCVLALHFGCRLTVAQLATASSRKRCPQRGAGVPSRLACGPAMASQHAAACARRTNAIGSSHVMCLVQQRVLPASCTRVCWTTQHYRQGPRESELPAVSPHLRSCAGANVPCRAQSCVSTTHPTRLARIACQGTTVKQKHSARGRGILPRGTQRGSLDAMQPG
jgi:hypothetical protein